MSRECECVNFYGVKTYFDWTRYGSPRSNLARSNGKVKYGVADVQKHNACSHLINRQDHNEGNNGIKTR